MELPPLFMQEMINNNNLLDFSELPEEKLIMEDYGDIEPMNVDNFEQDVGGDNEENEYYEDEDEEPYEDDDSLLNLEIEHDSQLDSPPNLMGSADSLPPVLETNDIHPTDQEIDNFLNYSPIVDQENINISEASFHSIQNSRNTSTSVFHKNEEPHESKQEMCKSTSSKRKNNEGMDDTASSDLCGGKGFDQHDREADKSAAGTNRLGRDPLNRGFTPNINWGRCERGGS